MSQPKKRHDVTQCKRFRKICVTRRFSLLWLLNSEGPRSKTRIDNRYTFVLAPKSGSESPDIFVSGYVLLQDLKITFLRLNSYYGRIRVLIGIPDRREAHVGSCVDNDPRRLREDDVILMFQENRLKQGDVGTSKSQVH